MYKNQDCFNDMNHIIILDYFLNCILSYLLAKFAKFSVLFCNTFNAIKGIVLFYEACQLLTYLIWFQFRNIADSGPGSIWYKTKFSPLYSDYLFSSGIVHNCREPYDG